MKREIVFILGDDPYEAPRFSSMSRDEDGNTYVVLESTVIPRRLVKINPYGGVTVLCTAQAEGDWSGVPMAQLICEKDGPLYFSDRFGNTGYGLIRSLTRSGQIRWSIDFPATNPLRPEALVEGTDGSLYGMGNGTFFRLSKMGSITPLVTSSSLTNCNSLIQGKDGSFYSVHTTWYNDTNHSTITGTVYRLNAVNRTMTHLCDLPENHAGFVMRMIQSDDSSFFVWPVYQPLIHLSHDGTLLWTNDRDTGFAFTTAAMLKRGTNDWLAVTGYPGSALWRVTSTNYTKLWSTNLETFGATDAIKGPDGNIYASDGTYDGIMHNVLFRFTEVFSPSITTFQPKTVFGTFGAPLTATGYGENLHYQWQRNGTNIVGATTSRFVPYTAGSYQLRVSNTNGVAVTPHITVVGPYQVQKLHWQNTNGTLVQWGMYRTDYINVYSSGKIDPSWQMVGQADFNSDGKTDYLFQNGNGQLVTWFMNDTALLRTDLVNTQYALTGWRVKGLNDFNGDGQTDLLLQNGTGAPMVRYMKGGTNVQGSVYLQGLATSGTIVGMADINADGYKDIITQDSSGRVQVCFMNGLTITRTEYLREGKAVALGWTICALADMNADGRTDILLQDSTGRIAVWLMNKTAYLGTVMLRDGISSGPGWKIVGPK